MRKLVCFSAALAVALSMSVGVAFAADDDDNGGTAGAASGSTSTSSSSTGTGVNGAVGTVGNTVTGLLGSNSTTNSTSTSTSASTDVTTTPTPTPTPAHHPHFPGHVGGHFGDPWYPGIPYGFPQLIGGAYLPVTALGLSGVGNVDVCGYGNWGAFDTFGVRSWGPRWGGIRHRFGANPVSTWLALRAAARCGSTVVVQEQLPSLYNHSYLNLSAYGLSGLDPVNVCSYATFDRFSQAWEPRFGGRWGGFRGHFGASSLAWRAGWNRLRLQASCAPTVVIAPSAQIDDPAVAEPEVTPVTDPGESSSAPKSSKSSDPGTGSIPSGHSKDGGFDVEYAASHGL